MNESTQEIELTKMKLVSIMPFIESDLARHFAIPARCDASVHSTFAHDKFVLRVVQEILGRFAEIQEARYPATWWEAIKERFAPEWFKKHWPVKEKVITLTARELYPSIAMPDQECWIDICKSETVE